MKYQVSWGNSPDQKSNICNSIYEAERLLEDYRVHSNLKKNFKIVEVL